MAWTAIHQSEIKARAGGSAKGRKLVNAGHEQALVKAQQKPGIDVFLRSGERLKQRLG